MGERIELCIHVKNIIKYTIQLCHWNHTKSNETATRWFTTTKPAKKKQNTKYIYTYTNSKPKQRNEECGWSEGDRVKEQRRKNKHVR